VYSLPECIGDLPLKNLDCARNKITALPASMPFKTLEMFDMSGNSIDNLASITNCIQLVTLAADDNQLTNLDDLDFEKLQRMIKLSACNNAIDNINSVRIKKNSVGFDLILFFQIGHIKKKAV
jgi:Leucine-rich repeat (LRR) protein